MLAVYVYIAIYSQNKSVLAKYYCITILSVVIQGMQWLQKYWWEADKVHSSIHSYYTIDYDACNHSNQNSKMAI